MARSRAEPRPTPARLGVALARLCPCVTGPPGLAPGALLLCVAAGRRAVAGARVLRQEEGFAVGAALHLMAGLQVAEQHVGLHAKQRGRLPAHDELVAYGEPGGRLDDRGDRAD